MIRSMFSAISGLRNHQTMMDVVGNNIANVNTTGFKSSSTVFADVLSQSVRGGGQAAANRGGTNPTRIGLGSRLASINTDFSQGSLQRTGRTTDFALQGDGFFIVESPSGRNYTRSGSFNIDAQGRLVASDGGFVQGWQANAAGTVNTSTPVTNLTIPVGTQIAPVMTTEVNVVGNLPANAAVGDTVTNGVDVYDGQGNPISLWVEYTKTGTDTWSAAARYLDASGVLQPTPPAAGTPLGTLTFDGDGQLTSSYDLTLPGGTHPDLPNDVTINLGSADTDSRVTQYGESNSITVARQDGSATGTLQSFTVSQEGLIVGTYSNGRTKAIGQLGVALFTNPEGLDAIGNAYYKESINSGLPAIGTADGGARGLIAAGTLEMSNVDLSQEFTNLILAQRGFQANSRVITTSDEMLQEVVNLKR
ncbi:MAG: flagellar hook protein FlgE [Microthrixaceae bacterium]